MAKQLADHIREARTRAGLTQAELADKLGVATQTIHRWEAGKTSIPAGRLADLAIVTGGDLNRMLSKPTRSKAAPDELERAKSGEYLGWWGDVVITFKGRAPTIIRAISGDAHEDFYDHCLSHQHFFSFIDMSGRLLVVNRSAVERLMLLDEGDDRNPSKLLDSEFDAPPSHPLAEFFGSDACGFNTDAETDRALQLVAELYGLEPLSREALLAAEADPQGSDLKAAIEEVGVIRLAYLAEMLEKSEDPYVTAERIGGRMVDVHLNSGVSRTVTLAEDHFKDLLTAGDQLENLAEMGDVVDLWATDDTLVEIFRWDDIAWVEASALHARQAFELGLEAGSAEK